MNTSLSKAKTDLGKELFDSLPSDAQTLLAILAIHTAPLRHHRIQEICGCLNAKPDTETSQKTYYYAQTIRKNAWAAQRFKAAVAALQKAGVVDLPHGQAQCKSAWRERIVHHLVEKGCYKKYAGILFNLIGGCYYSSSYADRSYHHPKTPEDHIREIRHNLIVGDDEGMKKFFFDFIPNDLDDPDFVKTLEVLFESPDNWLGQADQESQSQFLQFRLVQSLSTLKPFPPFLWNLLLETLCKPKCDPKTQILLLDYAFCTGKLNEIRIAELHGGMPSVLHAAHQAFLAGDYQKAASLYQQVRSFLPGVKGARNVAIPYLSGTFHALCNLHLGTVHPVLEIAQTALKPKTTGKKPTAISMNLKEAWAVIQSICVKLGGLTPERLDVKKLGAATTQAKWFPLLLFAHETKWFSYGGRSELHDALLSFAEKKQASFPWIAAEAAELAESLGAGKRKAETALNAAKAWRQSSRSVSLGGLITPKADWELWLESLRALSEPEEKSSDKKTVAKQQGSRLVWRVSFAGYTADFEPYEQVWQPKTQTWSLGRPVALNRLFASLHTLEYLTDQDRRAGTHIKTYQYGSYYKKTEYCLEDDVTLELIGHPLLFLAKEPTTRLELIQVKPEIVIKKTGDSLHVSFFPPIKKYREYGGGWSDDSDRNLFVIEETKTRYKVISLSTKESQIRKILGIDGKTFPQEAESSLTAMLGNLIGDVTVKTDAKIEFENVPEVPVDPKLYLYLAPVGEGLQAEFFVRPLGATGPSHRPGSGSERVIADIDGRRLQTVRNLADEAQRRDEVIARHPSFKTAATLSKDQYVFETAIDALTLLSELKDFGESHAEENETGKKGKKKSIQSSDLEIYWPYGEKYSVSSTASFGNLNLSFASAEEWLAASGTLQFDGDSIELQKLLELLDDQSESRFVKLSDKKFLALTNEFRKRLGELKRLSHVKGKSLQLHPLAAAGLEEFFDAVPSLQKNAAWKDVKKRIETARDYTAPFPKDFVGDLRDYQRDGYQWLARTAKWGVGCCLADDMGLGKTIQALALLLLRADQGPSLVVAPTSVCFNWEREAAKFAPTLNIKRIQPIATGSGQSKTQRDKLIASAKKRDVLVTSYSLMQQEIDLFAGKKYATVILDESQAIKNPESNRAKAAIMLQADFRIAMTGTPIENNLTELWSLFRFLNPGLLGSQKSFEDRFAVPIQRDHSSFARGTLRRLAHPFLLRRTKSQVLDELPARTEIIREIQLSRDETALYEAARLNALKELQNIKNANSGQGRLQILAALTRLRQLCCNPKMILPDSNIESSKLEVFREIMLELKENRHKVLVFSQFVKHLDILKAELDTCGITYQYLDGSTPARERQKRVDVFQSGESDAFLISIKAGGTGLNLTAADYVIHTDPSWN
ncbi:MAG: DEAD/DEAH box helicase, partial [Planctomycetaceae bacterium]|nr:DEAD/DEAH box helicase [Planctomycetaceae bacterium]